MSLLLLFNQPPFYRVLLDTARMLIQQKHPEIAVVTAQMACEIFAEQAFGEIFLKRGLEHLEGPIDGLLPSYNLANDRVRALYVAMTGDPIQNQPFWQDCKDAVARRNKAVHAGQRLSEAEAKEACAAADQVVTHLTAVLNAL